MESNPRRTRNQRSCMYCRIYRQKCEDPQGAVLREKCLQCIKNTDPCGPRETMQESVEYIRSQPPRSPSSPASRQGYVPVTANSPRGQDANDFMRMSSGARPSFTVTPVLPGILPTGANTFQQQDNGIFGTDDDQGCPISISDMIADFTMPNMGPVADVSLGNVLALGKVSGTRSLLNLFELFEWFGIVRAYIQDQSSKVLQSDLDLEKHLKNEQRRAFTQMLEEADKVCNDDQGRWVCDRLMSALEDVDHLEQHQIEGAVDRIINAHEIAGDKEVSPRLRKIMCACYPNRRTEEQNLAILIPKSPENSAIPSPSDAKPFGEWFPFPHQIIEFGTPALWSLFRRTDQLLLKPKTDHLGQGLFHLAAAKGDVNLLKDLRELGLEIDTRDRFGRTPAFIAASLGKENALEFFHSEGADLRVRTYESATLLEAAARGGHVGIIRKLKAFGYDFAEKAVAGESPLTIAAQNGCHEAAFALLHCGADRAFKRHSDGMTAKEVALSSGFDALVDILTPKD